MRITSGLQRLTSVALVVLLLGAARSEVPIIEAARKGDREALRSLIQQGADVNERAGDGATALLWAAYKDDVEGAQMLIRAGADVNAANDLGATPLWAAARNANPVMARLLLDAKAEPDIALLLGETPLVTAARSGSPEITEMLLAAGAEVNARGARGQTPLMFAASQRHPEVVRVLLAHGADVHARSHVWSQVLAQPPHSHVETMKEFLMGGNTALMFAVQAGDLESARLLVAAGADVNATSAWGFPPLTVAIYGDFGSGFRLYDGDLVPLDGERGVPGQYPELARFLIESGADPNVGKERFTALHAAILRENEEIVSVLLQKGADPNLPVGDWTPVERGNPADYIHKSWVGASPLWLAARYSTPAVVSLLLEAGADPHFVHNGVYYGGSPGGSLSQKREEVSNILMAAVRMAGNAGNGWNMKAPAFGSGQLEINDEPKVLEIVKLLVARGVDVNAVDNSGRTAIVGAMESDFPSVVEFLAANGAKMPDTPVQRRPSGRGGG
jgi:ankyrin repeat protein